MCKLKRTHAYYAQVQGQMGCTGAQCCDFVVHTKKGMSIERISFDRGYWVELQEKRWQYYFTHFTEYAAVNLHHQVQKLSCFVILQQHHNQCISHNDLIIILRVNLIDLKLKDSVKFKSVSESQTTH